jgi:hypothetical protein
MQKPSLKPLISCSSLAVEPTQTTPTSSLRIPQISVLLPQMLSHFIRATISLPLTLRTSSNRTEMSSLNIEMHAVLVTDAFIATVE